MANEISTPSAIAAQLETTTGLLPRRSNMYAPMAAKNGSAITSIVNDVDSFITVYHRMNCAPSRSVTGQACGLTRSWRSRLLPGRVERSDGRDCVVEA